MARVSSSALDDPFLTSLDGMCELLLVRHGEQQYTDGMTIAEAQDPPLTELGRQQVAALAERLAGRPIDAVFASPLARALATGAAVAARQGLTATVRDELREIESWQSFPQDRSLRDVYPVDILTGIFRNTNELRRWSYHPHAEDVRAFRRRIVAAIDRIVAESTGQRVVVACHGGVIAAYLAELWESPMDLPVRLHHTSITTVRAADVRRAVHRVNDYDHVLPIQTEVNPLNRH